MYEAIVRKPSVAPADPIGTGSIGGQTLVPVGRNPPVPVPVPVPEGCDIPLLLPAGTVLLPAGKGTDSDVGIKGALDSEVGMIGALDSTG